MKVEQKKVYKDIWFQVEYSWDNSDDFDGLDFTATRISSITGTKEGDCEFERQPMVVGYIKPDGDMTLLHMKMGNVYFGGRYMTKQYGELFDKLYDKAKEVGCSD